MKVKSEQNKLHCMKKERKEKKKKKIHDWSLNQVDPLGNIVLNGNTEIRHIPATYIQVYVCLSSKQVHTFAVFFFFVFFL